MARILWHGISPYRRTGYGVQTRIFAPLLKALGHELVICQMGPGQPGDLAEFDGIPIIGPFGDPRGYELPRPMDIRAAFGGKNPDLIWVLKDAWVLPPEQYRAWPVAVWANIDYSDRLGSGDREFFEQSGAIPVATSKHGLSLMRDAGLGDARYVPHGIDTGFWTPGDRAAARQTLGIPVAGYFVAGLNCQNLGQPSRKAFDEQLTAFAQFHGKHSKSMLLAHTAPDNPEGMPLRPIVRQLGIEDAVHFGAGMNMSETQMRTWYRALDVLLNATYAEGFGIPICEAIACGVPVIATDCSAMSEKVPPAAGWLVAGQPFYVPLHEARWTVPSITRIATALDKAYRAGKDVPAYLGALWDAGTIAAEQLDPLIKELTA